MTPRQSPEQPPKGFSEEEWRGWSNFSRNAQELADALHCTFDSAMLILGLNEIAVELGEIRDMLGHRRGPDSPDEPWRK